MDYQPVASPTSHGPDQEQPDASQASQSVGATKAKMLQRQRSAKKRAKSFKMRKELDTDRQKLDRLLETAPSGGGGRHTWLKHRGKPSGAGTAPDGGAGKCGTGKNGARSRLQRELFAFQAKMAEGDFASLNEDITAVWASKKRMQELHVNRAAGASGDQEIYSSVLKELEAERSRLLELMNDTQPDTVYAQMDAAASLHRNGMELLACSKTWAKRQE